MNRYLYLIFLLFINIPLVYANPYDDYNIISIDKILEYRIIDDPIKGTRIIDPFGNDYIYFDDDIHLLDYNDGRLLYAFKNKLWLYDEHIIDLNITIDAPYLAKFNDNKILFINNIKRDAYILDLNTNDITKITKHGNIVAIDWLDDKVIYYDTNNVYISDVENGIVNRLDIIANSIEVSPSSNKILYNTWIDRTKLLSYL